MSSMSEHMAGRPSSGKSRPWSESLLPFLTGRARENALFYVLILPFTVLTILFGIGPIVLSMVVSLTDSYTALSSNPEFVGLANFKEIFADRLFLSSTGITLVFTVVSVALNIGVALALAFFFSAPALRSLSPFLQLAIFLPFVTPDVATFIVWKWMFNQDLGVVNAVLLDLGLPPFAGIATQSSAFITLVIVELWHHVGFYTIIFMANIRLLDPSLDGAAQIDGARLRHRIWHIWLPQMRPSVIINVIYALIAFLKTYTSVVVITRGGPNYATNFLSYYAYTKFDSGQYGQATAMATVLFAIVVALTLLSQRIGAMRDYRE